VTSDVSKVSSEEAALSAEETILGQTAWFLHERGDVQAAALLLDVEGIEWSPGNRFGDWMDARLLVPGWLIDRFSEDLLARIRDALLPIAERNGVEAHSVYVGPALPDVAADWRSTSGTAHRRHHNEPRSAYHRSETGTATRRIRF
jgi:hypothetical protein